eukprot:scaffold38223_cov153-Amphora_coffeaeformis.AAC.1
MLSPTSLLVSPQDDSRARRTRDSVHPLRFPTVFVLRTDCASLIEFCCSPESLTKSPRRESMYSLEYSAE